LKKRVKKIISILAIFIMTISMLPPVQVRAEIIEIDPAFIELEPFFVDISPAIAIPMPAVALAQVLMDALGIASGILPTSTCICTGFLQCVPNMCVSNPTSHQIWDERHNLTLAAAQKNAANHTFDAVREAQKIIDSGWSAVDEAERIINRQLPPPPPGGGGEAWRILAAAGVTTLPMWLFRTSESDLNTILDEHTENAKTILEEQGFYFCFINQDFRHITPLPPTSDYVLGFFNGIPIVQENRLAGTMNHQNHRNVRWGSQRYHSGLMGISHRSVVIRDTRYQITGVELFQQGTGLAQIIVEWTENNVVRRGTVYGHVFVRQGYQFNVNIEGFLLKRDGDNYHLAIYVSFSERVIPDWTTTIWQYNDRISALRIANVGNINLIGSIDVNQPSRPPSVYLSPNNTIQSPERVRERVREIAQPAGQPDTEDEDLIILVPDIRPDMFPQIPEEFFADFARELLEQLTIEHVIMPGDEAREFITNNPELPRFPFTETPITPHPTPTPMPPPPQIDVRPNLQEIQRRLEEQNRILSDMPEAITGNLPDIKMEIEYTDSTPFLFDFSILFDSMPNLMEYFPFSIPFDLYNTFRVIAGQMPVETVGMTLQEARAFTALMENSHRQAEIMALHGGHVAFQSSYAGIEPMFLTDTAPRFEIEIPEPFNYTFVFDMNDYTALIGVVRWSLLVIFIIGLYKLTPLLIRW